MAHRQCSGKISQASLKTNTKQHRFIIRLMKKTNRAGTILQQYQNGQRYFSDFHLMNESFEKQDLQDAVFEDCTFYCSFREANLKNTRFVNGSIKTCDFRDADLTSAHFENLCIEGAQFARSKTDGIFFDNNSAYGQHVSKADFDAWIKDHEEA